ncbi:MAG: hypothetical protein E7533_04630 [Ruminococcaceae bacterium]|nr:hypothetical protein [Oscillospiraceae bacterium]
MSDTVISAVITGLLTLLGVIVTNISSGRKMRFQIEKSQAITDVKVEELTREVRQHNNFAARMPVVEEQIKVINHRLNDIERGNIFEN